MYRKLFALSFLLSLLPSSTHAKLRVVSTTEDLAYFARIIGGERAEVSSILKGYQDPHFAQAKPSYMVAVNKADLVLSVGLDLEIGWLPLVLQGARNPKVMPGEKGFLDCSEFIEPIEVPPSGADRSKGDLHPKGNPHYWLDPLRALAVARGIEARMEVLDPEGAQTFREGLGRLEKEIEAAKAEVERIKGNKEAPPIVTYHVTFSYFFQRFGLSPVAFIEPKPGIPPTPSHIATLEATLRSLPRPPLFLVEPYYDQDLPRRLAEKSSGRFALVASSVGGLEGVKTYSDLLKSLAKAIWER